MTTLSEAREAIYETFNTAWADQTDLTFDNEGFSPSEEDPWVRLAVRHTASKQETLGAPGDRKFARFGAAFVQVFTPVDGGTAPSDTLIEDARAVFEGNRINGTTIRFNDVIVREEGRDESWCQTVVEAQFEYDETK